MYKFNKDEKATNVNKSAVERRNFERFYLPVAVQYSIPGKKQIKGDSTAKNISLGGIQFHVQDAMDLGSRITLRIHLPRRATPTTVIGEVVWIKEHHKIGGGFMVGLKFTQADPFDLEELLKGALPFFHRAESW